MPTSLLTTTNALNREDDGDGDQDEKEEEGNNKNSWSYYYHDAEYEYKYEYPLNYREDEDEEQPQQQQQQHQKQKQKPPNMTTITKNNCSNNDDDPGVGTETIINHNNPNYNTSDNVKQTTKNTNKCGSFLLLLLLSNLIFVIGSALYLWLAITDWNWSVQVRDVMSLPMPQQYQIYSNSSYYESLTWDQLPNKQKRAAAFLGYSQIVWDTYKEPPIENLDWDDLTFGQKEAAAVLGFNRTTWDGYIDISMVVDDDNVTTDDDGQLILQILAEKNEGNNDENAIEKDWAELTPEQREAAKVLGYTWRKWANDRQPNESDLWWSDLSQAQQEAASILGYNRTSWDGPNTKYWDELSIPQQQAAISLGYNSRKWQNQRKPETVQGVLWDDLDDEQRDAAILIGFNRTGWDDEVETFLLNSINNNNNRNDAVGTTATTTTTTTATSTSTTASGNDDDGDNNNMVSKVKTWGELSPEQRQQAAESLSLGNNSRKKWDNLWKNPEKIRQTPWDDLTKKQQGAARVIGFNKKAWEDEREDKDDGASTSVFFASGTVVGKNDEINSNETAVLKEEGSGEEKGGHDEEKRDKEEENIKVAQTVAPYKLSWSELSQEEKRAGHILGYTKRMWDTGKDPLVTSDLSWEDLSDEQRESAKILGYSEMRWDGIPYTDAFPVHYMNAFVFQVPSTDTRVSRYMVTYFCAALCFVIMGVLDLIRERKAFHVLMIVAGLMGVVSAMLVERNPHNSNIFNLVSVHFYMLEAIAKGWHHYRNPSAVVAETTKSKKGSDGAGFGQRQQQQSHRIYCILAFADFCFGAGSLVETVLSYIYVLDVYANFSVPVTASDVAAQSLWVVCSATYLVVCTCCFKNEVDDNDKHNNVPIIDSSKEAPSEEEGPHIVQNRRMDEEDPFDGINSAVGSI